MRAAAPPPRELTAVQCSHPRDRQHTAPPSPPDDAALSAAAPQPGSSPPLLHSCLCLYFAEHRKTDQTSQGVLKKSQPLRMTTENKELKGDGVVAFVVFVIPPFANGAMDGGC